MIGDGTRPGLWPSLETVLGADSFKEDNEATRWETFFASERFSKKTSFSRSRSLYAIFIASTMSRRSSRTGAISQRRISDVSVVIC
jgi:hypothetical protein